ncbi:cupredoxin domain-containing protein [Streptomyces sp. NPDC051569]|uniref:cupredoxin domain-containing protein n=1 Tax=Streptomyces sp. NPDC051569 TaxID=3365661 RepID=UPI0037959797
MKSNTRAVTAVAAAMLCVAAVAGCSGSGGESSARVADSAVEEASVPEAPAASVSAGTSSTPSAPSAVKVSLTSSPIGKILVNEKGHTLYLFEKDKTNKSSCEGECADDWPPLIVTGTAVAGKGVNPSLLSTSVRTDGSQQVTYHGHPLYLFEGDKKAGETKGQASTAFGAKWFVLDAAGNRNTVPVASASPSASSSSSGQTKITINNFKFMPASITVSPGAKITVTNKDTTTHTLTAITGKAFNTGDIGVGKTVTFTAPKKAGTYKYMCTIHPFMKGTLIVK